jgi:hypothetical protein
MKAPSNTLLTVLSRRVQESMVALALAVTLASQGCGGSSSRGLLVLSVVSQECVSEQRGVDCCLIGSGDSGCWW